MFDLLNFGGNEQGGRHSHAKERSKIEPGKPGKLIERAMIEDGDGEVEWPTQDAIWGMHNGLFRYMGYRQEGHTVFHIYTPV